VVALLGAILVLLFVPVLVKLRVRLLILHEFLVFFFEFLLLIAFCWRGLVVNRWILLIMNQSSINFFLFFLFRFVDASVDLIG